MLPWLAEPASDHLSTVRDTPLAKLVRDDMLAMILRGELQPGERINEPDVASRLGVSRVPVREALRELEGTGLVIARKHAGVFVREPTAGEVRDLYEMRGLLDGFAGRRAARLEDAARTALANLLDASITAMDTASDAHDVQRYYRENLRFHWAIVEAADNHALAETYRTVVQKLHLSRLRNLAQDMGMRASIAEHTRIARALRKGDVARCEDLMARHVSDAYDRLQRRHR
ncbi:GntR family transcriptional regulator [Verminephrobacter aporrectodeae]|uniref:GntR family transcriptional regulator n=1 Tax=Verminephrobacter aporrectodeae TaxID=1110389 RepID=UPI002237AD15|nr:FCD domain-containing protein [Verminephrobacter aporrectodeae]MCW5220565.1 FCD domain-containing protein [Verminephrobacter aporrectodeae subsp. tuberculatae]MCW5255478.1 FCD domain-containing protein [Verminephrobacter aporrectodeae subsp. tuberculatae]MCW5289861.1 FCD domain-containing protein [Verminephrobacter aporrectodeae subsp. tuberculatae]MCW8174916.1 FCD domain-containing protein [Verminephrobacter aporrectodeae subsp. tuberculatae]MCW8202936.1 FCD domain-containing protein [Verm